ncbi:MAG: hypothetical protein DRI57_30215, partial [Deltaproteobacteria bacterium]
VYVTGDKGTVKVNLLFDSGSDTTYVTTSLVKRLGLKWLTSANLKYSVFGGGKSSECTRNVFELPFDNQYTVKYVKPLAAIEVPIICNPVLRAKPSACTDFLSNCINRLDCERAEVDILVGLDYYWDLVLGTVVRNSQGLVSMETVFGWVVSGTGVDVSQPCVSQQLFCMSDVSDDDMRRFCDSVQFDGRCVVSLSGKRESAVLDDPLLDLEKDGVISEVCPEEVGSQPVFPKEFSSSTTVRQVFDAPVKGPKGLDDCLDNGPLLIPNTVEVFDFLLSRENVLGLCIDAIT